MGPGLEGQTWMSAHSGDFRRGLDWRTSLVQLAVVVVRLHRFAQMPPQVVPSRAISRSNATRDAIEFNTPCLQSDMRRVSTDADRQVLQP